MAMGQNPRMGTRISEWTSYAGALLLLYKVSRETRRTEHRLFPRDGEKRLEVGSVGRLLAAAAASDQDQLRPSRTRRTGAQRILSCTEDAYLARLPVPLAPTRLLHPATPPLPLRKVSWSTLLSFLCCLIHRRPRAAQGRQCDSHPVSQEDRTPCIGAERVTSATTATSSLRSEVQVAPRPDQPRQGCSSTG